MAKLLLWFTQFAGKLHNEKQNIKQLILAVDEVQEKDETLQSLCKGWGHKTL